MDDLYEEERIEKEAKRIVIQENRRYLDVRKELEDKEFEKLKARESSEEYKKLFAPFTEEEIERAKR